MSYFVNCAEQNTELEDVLTDVSKQYSIGVIVFLLLVGIMVIGYTSTYLVCGVSFFMELYSYDQ